MALRRRKVVAIVALCAASACSLLAAASRYRQWLQARQRWESGQFYAVAVMLALIQYADEHGHYPDDLMALKNGYWDDMPERSDVVYAAAGQVDDPSGLPPWGTLLFEETGTDAYRPFRRGRFVVFDGGACWIPFAGRCTASGLTELHVAALAGREQEVRRLLAEDPRVDVMTWLRWTPLHLAALYGHRDVVELLLGNGADPHAEDVVGRTPIDMAEAKGHRAVADILRGDSRPQ